MISDESIDKALDWLRDNAVKAAQSRGLLGEHNRR